MGGKRLLPFPAISSFRLQVENRVRQRRIVQRNAFHQDTPPRRDIFHQHGRRPSCFPATFHYPRHTNLFRCSAPHFPGALTRETRWGLPSPSLPSLNLYPAAPRRQDTPATMGFSETLLVPTVGANSPTDSSPLVSAFRLIVEELTTHLFSPDFSIYSPRFRQPMFPL